MSARNDRIKALARDCAAECILRGMNSDGSLSDDTHVAFLAEDAYPTTANIKALRDTLDGERYSWDDRILFDKTFEDSVSTLLAAFPRRAP